jgi:hypothetical protein
VAEFVELAAVVKQVSQMFAAPTPVPSGDQNAVLKSMMEMFDTFKRQPHVPGPQEMADANNLFRMQVLDEYI